MKYGDPYREVEFSPQSLDIVRMAISTTDLKINPSIKNITHHTNKNNPINVLMYFTIRFITLFQLLVLFQA